MIRLQSKVESLEHLISSSLRNTSDIPADHSPNLTSYEAGSGLEIFRREMMQFFPFVAIPTGMTREMLVVQKPMLCMAIDVVTQQADLSTTFREKMSQRVVINGEKDLDLLQSILVYLAWNHVHVDPGTHFITMVYIATALTSQLGLDQITRSRLGALRELERPNDPKVHTNEEIRALLGLSWLTSTFSNTIQDISGLNLTMVADFGCQRLREFPSDAYLIQLTQIQQLASSTRSIYRGILELPMPQVEATAAISSLNASVKDLGIRLDRSLPHPQLLTMSYCSLEVYLYKVSLDGICPDYIPSLFTAAITIVNEFSNVRDSVIPFLPYPFWIQLGHAILILSRVLAMGHDPMFSLHRFEFQGALEQLMHKLERVIRHGKEEARRLADICSMVELEQWYTGN
ncbi:hypothetical protein B0I35DRAFT_444970 [Stachybotrys elegans]|uniref:Transcription factor domain-containing protein n=1 Tax=Stachybotrys elegans TaxID=80388 RepID=A0A8K0SI93_9HYPO|nr:hypothetical protein B0I35DRAFT_444970 [Stachybotrys elegans]